MEGTGRESARTRPGLLARLPRELALQDWLVLAYLGAFLALIVLAPPHARRTASLLGFGLFAAVGVGGIVATRGGLVQRPVVGPLAYRVAVYGVVQLSYFLLRDVLPVVTDRAYDAELHAVDLALFGVDPVVWLERWMTPWLTAWLAACYLSYFGFVVAWVMAMLLVERREALTAELMLALLLVYTVGQLGYVVVPGYGPATAFPQRFAAPLPPGPMVGLLERAVRTGGALKDIFPSLHTAGPVVLAAFAWRHRRRWARRAVAPMTVVLAGNIVVATVALRWHYAVDVLAGLLLAGGAVAASAVIAPRELAWRRRTGRTPLWPPMPWQRDPTAG